MYAHQRLNDLMRKFFLSIVTIDVFITLPFDAVDNTGVLLPLLQMFVIKALKNRTPNC
jgi:hypothetical protein